MRVKKKVSAEGKSSARRKTSARHGKGKETRAAMPNTGSEPIPPGATVQAADRETTMAGAGEGLGTKEPYHAANDPGSPDESYGATDSNEPLADMPPPEEELDELEKGPPYAGPSGGAVGGAVAEGRSSGGRIHGGFKPQGVHRGDSTIGTDPDRE